MRMHVCKHTYQHSVRYMHLVITHTHSHIPILFISPKECLSSSESLCPIGWEALLRPLEVPDDVTSRGGAKAQSLSCVDRVHVRCPSSHVLHCLYDDSIYKHTSHDQFPDCIIKPSRAYITLEKNCLHTGMATCTVMILPLGLSLV